MSSEVRVAPGADVDESAVLGDGTVVWHLAQVREGATVGESCIIGRGAYIDAGVQLGARCKVQNHALLYAPARIADGVFIGPAVCLTNDTYPRAVSPEGEQLGSDDWDMVGVTIEEGASIGARAVVLGGTHVGAWALVAGVPARQIGWVDRRGRRVDGPPDQEGAG